MKRRPFIISLLLACAGPVSAQVFVGMPELAGALNGIHESERTLDVAVAEEQKVLPGLQRGAPDVSAYPVHGIDVSRWQGQIDWSKVGAAGVSFSFIEATVGNEPVDPSFARNWAAAKSVSIPRGAYHFYDFCKPGLPQAEHFIETVPVEDGALAPMIDLERPKHGCRRMPSKEKFLAQFKPFLAAIQKAYGRVPIFYVNYGIYDTYLKGENFPDRIWIADPDSVAPQISDGQGWTLWQFSWKGHLDGITGKVDLDVFHGSADQMLSELRSVDASPLEVASR